MELTKKSIRSLKGYKTNNIQCRIKLDANEGKNILLEDDLVIDKGFSFNLYPDNEAAALREEISRFTGIKTSNILPGNGSSEMIELVIKTYADKNDVILSFTPTFSMYSIFSQVYAAKFVSIKCNENFSVDIKALTAKAQEINPKVIFLCNPNNPTGYLIDKSEILYLLDNTDSIVVIDEAYIEFGGDSIVNEISEYKNLIVLRTMSKAFGLASLRLGYMVSNDKIINLISKVKAPYTLNAVTQYIGVRALKNADRVTAYIDEVKQQREYLFNELIKENIKAYKSSCNFVFFYLKINDLLKKLQDHGILIRGFSGDLKDYYRVSVGYDWENKKFIESLKEIIKNENCRD